MNGQNENFVPISKEIFKNMTAVDKERVIAEFKQECLLTSGDIQGLVDFVADVLLLNKTLPTNVDMTKLIAAINGEEASDPKTLAQSDVAEGGNNG